MAQRNRSLTSCDGWWWVIWRWVNLERMSQKGPLTCCGDCRWGTRRWANLQWGCQKRRGHSHPAEIIDGECGGEQIWLGMSQKKGPLTRCGDRRLGTRRWPNLEQGCQKRRSHSQAAVIENGEHGGQKTGWGSPRRGHSLAAEIEDGEHGGEQTWSRDLTKEGATHFLRRLKMGNTAVSRLGAGMSHKKGSLTCCGDWRWGTWCWANRDVTKEGATHNLRRLKMGNTAVSKLAVGMPKKELLTSCGDWR